MVTLLEKKYRIEKMASIENSKSSHTNMKVKFFNRLLKGARTVTKIK